MTVPEMAMSLSEIMRRSSRGLGVMGNANPKFDDDDSEYELDFITPDFQKMDLAERQQLAEEASAEVERLRIILNEKARVQRDEEKRKADELALNEFKRMQAELQKESENKFIVRRESDESTNTP